jgi:hypothetical protein
MPCSATIRYDRRLVRAALNRYMARRLGKSFFIAIAVVLAIFLLSFFTGGWNWLLTALGLILFAFLAFILFIYSARLRAAEGFFDKANEPTVTFQFTDDGVVTESDLGNTNLKWQVFDEILKFPDIWLLVYARSGYMTLPVDQLTTECLQFIEKQISSVRK